jgi:site-specific DNA-methyltransferase (adenine-specific)
MKFQIIIADPPWWYADQKKERKDGAGPTKGIGACHHYDQMKTNEIARLGVYEIAAPRCHLYLWATMPLLPDALKVMAGWGFEYTTVAFCWVKVNSKRFDDAILDVLQPTLCDNGRTVENFLDSLTFFGPGFYTGSNIELVLLGTKGQPFRHAEGRKASQIVYAPLGKHSAKPDEIQKRIEWMYPAATQRLEMFARRQRLGWTTIGNECPGTEGEDIRDSLKWLAEI